MKITGIRFSIPFHCQKLMNEKKKSPEKKNSNYIENTLLKYDA